MIQPTRAQMAQLALLAAALASATGAGAAPPRCPEWGAIVRRVSGAGRAVALTFDDGPREPYTSQILDILADQGIKATFFLVGENVRRYPAVTRRIVREGHAIGNHSWSHRSLASVSWEVARREIKRTDALIRAVTGRRPFLFRPPYGALGSQLAGPDGLAARERHLLVLWSVEVADWSTRSPLRVAAGTIRRVSPGSIVLLHDGGGPRGHVVTATRWMAGHLAREGYRLVTVPELLGIASARR